MSLLLPAGALADRFRRRPLLIIGLSVFTFASFLCGAAPNLAVLITARDWFEKVKDNVDCISAPD